MFQINDTVIYGTQGACKISEIMQKKFAGKPMKYYVLKPIYDENSTVYIPVDNQGLVNKMRRLLSAREIHEIIQAMPDEECVWIENEHERKQAYKDIISRGDRLELVKLIKTLYFHQQAQQAKGRKLHMADERYFKEAEKLLYSEFALVLNIEPEQVVPFIANQIEVEGKPSV